MAKGAGGVRTAGSQGPTIPVTPSGRPVRMAPLNIERNYQATEWFQSPVNAGMIVKAKGSRVARVFTEENYLTGGVKRVWVQLFENGVMQGAAQLVRSVNKGKLMGDVWVSRGE